MSKIPICLLILFVYINYSFSLIVFPFTIPENKEKSFNLRNGLHSTTYMGESKQLTDLFFSSEDHLYFIEHENCKGENFFKKNFSTYEKSSYVIDLEEEEQAYQVNETIYLYKDLELNQIEKIGDFPFLIKTTTLRENTGCFLLGILYRTNEEKRKINFLEEIKKRNLTNGYVWTFKYKTENDGLFIIGNEPHVYDPNNYNASNYLKILPQIDPKAYGWKISFDKIYSGENQLPNGISCRLSFSNNYILSDSIYNKTISVQFFNKYIQKGICHYYYKSFSHSYYYCDKDKFKLQDIKSFPELIMTNIKLEMNFSFSGEELFFEGKDYYYFKMYFMDYSTGGWILGQLFLKKYQLIFDNDEKTIGYYNNFRKGDEEKDDENKKKEKGIFSSIDEIYIYMLIPLIIIVLGAIIFVLTKYYFCEICCNKKRKKMVNELEDENKEDYFNINSDNKGNNEDDRKLYKSTE